MVIFFTVVLGLIVGLLSTFLGLGGGLFFVTFLPRLYEMDHKIAIGTGLASVFFIVSLNTWRFHRRGLVNWGIVFKLAPSTLLSAFLAGKLGAKIPNEILILILAGVLGFLSFWSFANRKKRESERKSASFWKINLLGFYSGGISGLTGIGSGAITSTCFLNWNITYNKRVAPTSNAVMVLTTFSALLAYLNFQNLSFYSMPTQIGYVRLDIALLLFLSSLFTTYFGVRLQSRIPEDYRRLAIAILLLALCFYESYLFYILLHD